VVKSIGTIYSISVIVGTRDPEGEEGGSLVRSLLVELDVESER